MNISSGISQVIYQTRLPGKILLKRAYLWPEYNAGAVQKVSSIKRENSDIKLNMLSSGKSTSEINDPAFNSNYSRTGSIKSVNDQFTKGLHYDSYA